MRIVETTKAQSNEMISELDQLRKAKEKATFGDDVIRAKGNVKRGFRKMYETANPLTEVPDEDYVLPRELQVGDTVMLTDTKQKAVVAGKPDKNGTVFCRSVPCVPRCRRKSCGWLPVRRKRKRASRNSGRLPDGFRLRQPDGAPWNWIFAAVPVTRAFIRWTLF